MRIIDLVMYRATRKRESFYVGLFFSVPISLVIFLILIGSGFFGALLFGLLVFAFLFGVIYLIREITHKSVDRRHDKATFEVPYIEVKLYGEIGALSIYPDKLHYTNLTPGGSNKDFEIPIDEHLYMSVGEIQYTKLQSMKQRDIKEGFILVKPMPNGIPYQFQFYDIDDSISKVSKMIEEANKYKE